VLALTGIWPNPVRAEITVSLTLKSADRAKMEVLDVSGRSVLRKDLGSLGPGAHVVHISEGSELPTGVYFLRVIQAGESVSKPMIVIR